MPNCENKRKKKKKRNLFISANFIYVQKHKTFIQLYKKLRENIHGSSFSYELNVELCYFNPAP